MTEVKAIKVKVVDPINTEEDPSVKILNNLDEFFQKSEETQNYLLENYADEEKRKEIETEREKRKTTKKFIDFKTFSSLRDSYNQPCKIELQFNLNEETVYFNLYVKKPSVGQLIELEQLIHLAQTVSFWEGEEKHALKRLISDLVCVDETGTAIDDITLDMILNDLNLILQVLSGLQYRAYLFKKN